MTGPTVAPLLTARQTLLVVDVARRSALAAGQPPPRIKSGPRIAWQATFREYLTNVIDPDEFPTIFGIPIEVDPELPPGIVRLVDEFGNPIGVFYLPIVDEEDDR